MESPLRCQAILFDLDGTLIDSTARILRLWQSWTARHGIAYEWLVEIMYGRTAAETIQMVAPHLHPDSEIDALETEEVGDMHDVVIFPGARELLAGLPPDRWAIVTSGSRRVAQARINHVGLPLPRVLITSDLVERGKPAPDGYLLAARRLGMRPEDCVVVEDTPVGVEAGRAAGMRTIAVSTTNPASAFSSADALVPTLSAIEIHPSPSALLISLHL